MTRILALLATVAVLALSTFASAQDSTLRDRKVSLELNSVDVREALRALFKSVEGSYTVSPDVQGSVTVLFQDVPFETGLQAILVQVDASFRVVGGIYEIVPRVFEPPLFDAPSNAPVPDDKKVTRKIYIHNADPALILRLLAGNQDLIPPILNRRSNIGGGFAWSGFGGGLGGSVGISFGGGGWGGF